jgi:hypothetical protein
MRDAESSLKTVCWEAGKGYGGRCGVGWIGSPPLDGSRRRKTRLERSAVRGVRQKGSNYRCCLPALAGFARPKSASPDGTETMEGFE